MTAAVSVAVIPCAGSGTRMRPATRVVPKPLIPVVDRPVIQYVVEEAVAAGVTEVVLVVDDRPGNPVVAHFTDGDPVPGLEAVTFRSVLQAEPRGLGDAVLTARGAVGDRPFVCLLSDMFPRPGRSFTPRLVSLFDGRFVMAVRRVSPDFFDRYGIVAIDENITGDVVEVESAVEKPGAAAPSDLGLVGRYVFTPGVFDDLAALDPGHGGEIQLTDAIDRGARRDGALALIVGDDLLDIGRPAGLLEATAAVGLSRPDLAGDFRATLEHLLE
ncbi:MAG TPA: sugar phosphate nucleotidyltransferase [Acidimicrobiia bacterium]|nr:sugar phosphate nucleotidyltransferase [Acidimicrobiia bacterium]